MNHTQAARGISISTAPICSLQLPIRVVIALYLGTPVPCAGMVASASMGRVALSALLLQVNKNRLPLTDNSLIEEVTSLLWPKILLLSETALN